MFHSIKAKILILGLAPLILALTFAAMQVFDRYRLAQEMEAFAPVTDLGIRIGSLLHETQKERGASAGYLAKGSQAFLETMRKQRQLTDEKRHQLLQFLGGFSSAGYGEDFANSLQQALAALQSIDAFRTRVDQHTLDLEEELEFYTHINRLLLDVVRFAAYAVDEQEINHHYSAYENFMQAKEREGVIRAVLSAAFGQNHFAGNTGSYFIRLLEAQSIYLAKFTSLASPAQREFYAQTLSDPRVAEVTRMVAVASKYIDQRLSATTPQAMTGFGIDSKYWFDTITHKINLLKKVEDRLAGDLQAAMTGKQQQAWHDLQLLVSIALASVGIILAALWFVGRSISLPLLQATGFAKRVANGDLSGHIETHSQDEIGHLCEALNYMRSNLRTMIHNLSDTAVALTTKSGNINDSVSLLADSMQRQHIETDQVATAMNEMAATVQDVARNAEEGARATHSAHQETKKGQAIVAQVADTVHKLADDVRHSSGVIQELSEKSRNIGTIIETISGIAEQTNLLALNAAIEAARAGEHGRGFAVVADEVRSLANRTQDATQEINSVIEELCSGVEQAVTAMDVGRSRAEAAVAEAGSARDSLSEIDHAVDSIDSMTTQIATAASEQGAVAEEMNRNVVAIADLADKTLGESQEIRQIGDQLVRIADDLMDKFHEFKIEDEA
ncbi:methyl-accepting chemotaxis protein [Thiohalobacter sp. IOR34]|uniref:methyl-accepting chemotaxis protein n=1 Tax=Thiohalobacter sp. IOR34 TaxID=3057176 RepID=UPI0025B048B5|nr:methyl-accepting chemotaxis protein [Thiohalobacter sp. IOR34]WJW76182.1 methyl-accepting chemotaxis protein [Thiohalobacter sp. IOR34]